MSLGIGDRIRKKRLELHWTQEDLSSRMGYKSKAAVCKVEKGEDNITTDRLEAFAKALGCTATYLMGWDEEEEEHYIDPETVKKAQELFNDNNMRLLFDAAKDSKPEDLQMAADLLKRLKGTNPDG